MRQIKPVSLLLDLSGDERSAFEWAKGMGLKSDVRVVNKAELKWESKLRSLKALRLLKPGALAIYTSDLRQQSSRGAMLVFGALTGARRTIIGDRTGRKIERSRTGAFCLEVPRLIVELVIGYVILVPAALFLTYLVGALVKLSRIEVESREIPNAVSEVNHSRSLLYVRAVPLPAGSPASISGGMAAHINGFIGGAEAMGHRVTLLACGAPGVKTGLTVIEVINPSALISATRALFELWNNLTFTINALRWASRESPRFEFIYQRYNRFNFTGVVLSLAARLPLVLEFNGSEVWIAKHWDPVGQLWLLDRIEKLNLRAARLVVTISEAQKRSLEESGLQSERILVNPNGVDPDEFRPGCGGRELRRQLGIDGNRVVGFSGTFGPWHGAEVLARAAMLVDQTANCHFLFVGDGERRAAAEEILGKRNNVTFVGRVPLSEMPAYLDACDIFVSPHDWNEGRGEFFGSPTKLFEYMAMGRPIVASRTGQIADVIQDNENGLLVEPANALALAKAIELAARDGELAARLGAAARRTAVEKFTWTQNVQRVIDVMGLAYAHEES